VKAWQTFITWMLLAVSDGIREAETQTILMVGPVVRPALGDGLPTGRAG